MSSHRTVAVIICWSRCCHHLKSSVGCRRSQPTCSLGKGRAGIGVGPGLPYRVCWGSQGTNNCGEGPDYASTLLLVYQGVKSVYSQDTVYFCCCCRCRCVWEHLEVHTITWYYGNKSFFFSFPKPHSSDVWELCLKIWVLLVEAVFLVAMFSVTTGVPPHHLYCFVLPKYWGNLWPGGDETTSCQKDFVCNS